MIGAVFITIIVLFSSYLFPANPPLYHNSQEVSAGHSRTWKTPLKLYDKPSPYKDAYSINFTLGSPPQPFTAIVDISTTGFTVPSSRCRKACPHGPKYDSSASWSYRGRDGTRQTQSPSLSTGLIEGIDILTVAGGLQVSSQPFTEQDDYSPPYDESYRRSKRASRPAPLIPWQLLNTHIKFGLAIHEPWAWLSVKASHPPVQFIEWDHSPFRMMIEEGVLDKNIFSLKFPQNEKDEGHLIFGGYDSTAFEGDLVSHPIFPPSTPHWSVEASSLSMITTDISGNPRVLMNKSLTGYQAILQTLHSPLSFPDPLFTHIIASLNVTKGICQERVVDCDNLDNFPVITIGIRDQKISLTGRDYIRRIRGPSYCKEPGLIECVPSIQLRFIPNSRVDPLPWPEAGAKDFFYLGLTFLESVYTVIDNDERTISFGTLRT